MNIFVLDKDPAIAASMHCDQHLHKMILESAQMLSTVARYYCAPDTNFSDLYKPTHENHPCNVWLREASINVEWLVRFAVCLDMVRTGLGSQSHKSIKVVVDAHNLMFGSSSPGTPTPENFIFCGSDWISSKLELTVPRQYQLYYKEKAADWYLKDKPMTYTNRPVPEFLKGNPYVISINK